MNQTRVFLIFAWLMVAFFLWMEWGKFTSPAPAATTPVVTESARASSVPSSAPAPLAAPAEGSSVPQAPATTAANTATTSAQSAQAVTVTTDVLRLVIDGGSVLEADLLKFPQERKAGSPPVKLFTQDAQNYYVAESGWLGMGATRAAPNHEQGFVPEAGQEFTLGANQNEIAVPFIWHGPDGVTIRRTYTLKRGDYAMTVRDDIVNRGSTPWQGSVYRQLLRTPPHVKSGFNQPQSFSFVGATWYDNDLLRRKFGEDYLEDGKVDKPIKGGWIAMLQHHFFTAWIPAQQDTTVVSLDENRTAAGNRPLIREMGPSVNVAPGQQATTSARLWVGPKLVNKIKAENVPGFHRAVDYSRFALLDLIGQGLFWLLSHIHALLGNWGWSIIGLVVIVKAVLYPLSAAQYKSMAKMRRFQPRIQQLKERYGEDKQKFQVAMMELYKKEKINPVGGCLPLLVQMPIFFALYWVLGETVELRQAPWMGWIQDLTARDPYYILPVINGMVMWLTQKLTPTPGMDPMQARMMQIMPLVFGVTMAFFPSGLVLYWVTNGTLTLLQQWWMLKRHGDHAAPGKAVTAD